MEIKPQLILNRNPKDIPNGALVAAKNVIVDDTGSYFTNEDGFKVSFETPNDKEYIVGVIPCNNEIVIFTYEPIIDSEDSTTKGNSRVYRKFDDGTVIEVTCSWEYNNGTITGAYTYNYKGELIIAVSEYNAKDIAGNLIDVPLKSWNLNNGSLNLSYNVEENLPKATINYNIVNGGLNCGVYTLFIRYQIDKYNYTKWFQITDDIIIINNDSHEIPIHTFLNDNDTITTYNRIDKDNPDNLSKNDDFQVFQINGNKKSNKGIYINLAIDNSEYKYDKFQIGYIVKHNSEVYGRIYNTYSFDVEGISFLTNTYIEEENVDEFLRNPQQFYNVKNVINYNNRLYISNYSEYKNEDLNVYAKDVEVRTSIQSLTSEDNKNSVTKQLTVNTNGNISGKFSCTDVWSKYTLSNNEYIIDSNYITEFIRKFFTSRIYVFDSGKSYCIDKDRVEVNPYKNEYTLLTINDDYCLYIGNAGDQSSQVCIYESHTQSSQYVEAIKIDSNGFINIKIKSVSNWYVVGNGKTDANVLIHRKLYNKHDGNVEFRQFYGETKVQYYAPYRYITGRAINSECHEIANIYELTATSPYNNYHSLIPGQIYAFYIHYIRQDGSVTNGYLINNDNPNDNDVAKEDGYFDKYINNVGNILFRCPVVQNVNTLIFPKFNVSNIPTAYIGWFISYEKVEDNVYCGIVTDSNKITNTPFQYNNDVIQGNKLFYIQTSAKYGIDLEYINAINNVVKSSIEPHIELPNKYLNVGSLVGIYSDNKDIYNKSVKTLYRLTDNYYSIGNNDNNFKYIPSYLNKEKVVTYDKECIINPTSSYVLDMQSKKLNTYNIKLWNNYNYSKFPLNAYSIKQDFNEGAVSLFNGDGKTLGVYYNKVLSPDRLRDFLELTEAYMSAPSKTYTNYSEDFISTFDKTIRRSDIISDESLVNSFRDFDLNNYKVITENKGSITNIVGIGLYMLVHTEYSMFMFDRSPKLTQNSQLEIPDVFDIDYQEIIPSNEGFGGLKTKEESIVTKNGYVWYDSSNKLIFDFENGKVNVLSTDINNFIKELDINTVRFAEDIKYNRLLICIYFNVGNKEYNITISYNFNTKTFISLHDYSFTNNYRTYKNSYFFDNNKDKSRLYEFDRESTVKDSSYLCLTNNDSMYFPMYKSE